MYTVRMGSDVAEAQIGDLSDAEIDVVLEIYEVLRRPRTPHHGRLDSPLLLPRSAAAGSYSADAHAAHLDQRRSCMVLSADGGGGPIATGTPQALSVDPGAGQARLDGEKLATLAR